MDAIEMRMVVVNESGVKQTFKGLSFPPCRDIRTLLLCCSTFSKRRSLGRKYLVTPVMEVSRENVLPVECPLSHSVVLYRHQNAVHECEP